MPIPPVIGGLLFSSLSQWNTVLSFYKRRNPTILKQIQSGKSDFCIEVKIGDSVFCFCFFFYVKNPGNSYSSRLNLMHLDYLLQTLEWGLRIRIFKISWDNITTTAMVYHWVSYERQLCLITYRVKFYFTFSEWWLIYGQGGHKHRRKRTRANSHKLPELSLTGKLGKAKVSGDQNCVNGSHFFLGFNIWKAVYSSLLLQGVVLNRSCSCSRIRRSGTWWHRRNEDSKREGWAVRWLSSYGHLPPSLMTSSIPTTHVVERCSFYRLSSDLYVCIYACIYINTQTNNKTLF